MASSAPNSPPSSRGGSPSVSMPTPRSKIRALLATVESSDEEGNDKPRTTRKTHKITSDAAGSDSDSYIDVRPRGKLAARMQASVAASTKTKEPENTYLDARERVRQRLRREDEEKMASEPADIPAEEDDDDDLPRAPRRLKRRTERQGTLNQIILQETGARSPSPALFVSSPTPPSPWRTVVQGDRSDSEVDLPAIKSDRFKALVARKRQERLAREAAEEAERIERQEKLSSDISQLISDDEDATRITDDEGGRQLTQKVRPTRKASKKAIEEMNRETQRMARNMQLAHQMKVRKKMTTADLFARFNYHPPGMPEKVPTPQPSSSSRPSSSHSEGVEKKDADTPPSSPPIIKNTGVAGTTAQVTEDHDDLSTLDVLVSTTANPEMGAEVNAVYDQTSAMTKPPAPKSTRIVRVKLPIPHKRAGEAESDDELEIMATEKDKLNAIFSNLPQGNKQESHSVQVLRALAQIKSPNRSGRLRKTDSSKITAGGLFMSLQQKAREQAKVERERRLETLKAQGIVVQTAQERERQFEEVEDIVSKAREEAEMIMNLERAEAKKEKKDINQADPLAWDDSDDEYEDSANEADLEMAPVELSGSEDEMSEQDEHEEDEEGEAEEDGEEDKQSAGHPFFDTSVEHADTDNEEQNPQKEAVDDEIESKTSTKRRRARKLLAVLSDDEDEGTIGATPKPKSKIHISPVTGTLDSPVAPTSVLRSAKKTFIPGLPVHGAAGLGLTQIFAGTMDNSQQNSTSGSMQSLMPDFDHFPDSHFSATMDVPMDEIVEDSQRAEIQDSTQAVQLNTSQSEMRDLDSLIRDRYPSQLTETVEASQDAGLAAYTPLKDRFLEPPISTIETVVNNHTHEEVEASPLVQRGRLRRKIDVVDADLEDEASAQTTDARKVFNTMRDGAKQEERRRLLEDFDKKRSKAKEMVAEQAEESEDEYAGLGGADGEDSDNESSASVQEMIDDEAGNNVDEGKLAAFYADRERADDEKAVEKLFKDITTGMLRRKRGADYDLSDSDDGGEARRRMKRRQFAKMQKALFSDERVKKMAENPGNQAFLRTIEDRGSDDEVDILKVMDVSSESESESQPHSQGVSSTNQQQQRQPTIPDSQPRQALGAIKHNRPPAHLRRTKAGKKPSNIGEVRETLSNLLEEPQASIVPATEAGSDSEDEDRNKENQSPKRRQASGGAVVDRMNLKRSSSHISASGSKMAFTSVATASSSFKVPVLLRRATTNSSLLSGSSSGMSTPEGVGSAGGFGEEAKIKKGASKSSGVVSRVPRENTGRAKIEENERKREEKRMKGAASRIGMVGGLLGKGSFA